MTSQLLPVCEDLVQSEDGDGQALTLVAALQCQWQSASWYVSSLGIHSLVLLLLLLIPVEPPQKPARRIVVETDIVVEEEKIAEEPETDIVERDPDIVTEAESPVEAPIVVTTDFEVADHNETDEDMEMESARGDPDNVSTFGDVEGSPALMGVGASGGKGGSGRFGARNGGGKRNAVARGGGSRKTESAVDWALSPPVSTTAARAPAGSPSCPSNRVSDGSSQWKSVQDWPLTRTDAVSRAAMRAPSKRASPRSSTSSLPSNATKRTRSASFLTMACPISARPPKGLSRNSTYRPSIASPDRACC